MYTRTFIHVYTSDFDFVVGRGKQQTYIYICACVYKYIRETLTLLSVYDSTCGYRYDSTVYYHSTCSARYLQKRPISLQKRPTSLQTRPISHLKRPICLRELIDVAFITS